MTQEERDMLLYKPQNAHNALSAAEEAEMNAYCEDYKRFLDASKTERECVFSAIELAEKRGFVEYKRGMALNPGDKVYYNNRGKAIMLAVIGSESLAKGANIGAAHTDAPRLDIKPRPLFQASHAEMAYLKTHYYGGIRKYQWVATPLELHGKVMRRDGSEVYVKIGADLNDPQFIISDLLPHLGAEQGAKPLNSAIPAESLNILIGSWPERDDDSSDRVSLAILKLLHEKYGIIEEDFISAELQAVPAANARDLGLDRSLIGGYGHDDRVCAYPALMAALDCPNPSYTTVTVLTDKEEIGSVGNTGLSSAYLQFFIEDLAKTQGLEGRDVLRASECLSADVNAGVDPTFQSVHDKLNASFINRGIVVTKYTGARGKSDTSDANAEFVGKLRKLFDENNIVWQIGELGKVDEGGGGTVAKYVAHLGVDVVDVGVPVLSMHAPFEQIAKLDIYMAYKAFCTFYNQK